MKKHFKFSVLAIALVSLVYTSCKPDDDGEEQKNEPGKSKSELLTMKRWKITSLISSGTDIWNTPFVEACNKDNEYDFRTDDSLVVHDMNLKCDVNDPDSTSSYYMLMSDDKRIILNAKLTASLTVNDTADIETLDENTLRLNAEYSGLPATITFQHP